ICLTPWAVVDGLKFIGGSQSLMPKSFIREATKLAHEHDIYVSTGDWAEYLQQKDTLLRYIRLIKSKGLKAKPQFAVKFNQADIPTTHEQASAGFVFPTTRASERMGDIDVLIRRAERCLEAGADMISIDAGGVCRYADSVRADIIAKVNLFIDHSQVLDLERLRGSNMGKNHRSVLNSSFFLL
ncbi:protein heat-stress-associated 32, partial [Tanacetum coccineum]